MSWSFWFMAAVVLFLVEILTPGAFFFACLGIGALFAGLTVLLVPVPWIPLPWLVFAMFSLLSIYTIRPLARRMFQHEEKRTNVDALIGQIAVVTEALEPLHRGMVKVDGEVWRAEAKESIPEGARVQVTAVKGAHLEVRKCSQEE